MPLSDEQGRATVEEQRDAYLRQLETELEGLKRKKPDALDRAHDMTFGDRVKEVEEEIANFKKNRKDHRVPLQVGEEIAQAEAKAKEAEAGSKNK